jgi:hypothetical protein
VDRLQKFENALPSPVAGALLVPLRDRHGKVKACAWIDEEDAEQAQYRWCLNAGYALRRGRKSEGRQNERIYLHRELMGLRCGDKREVDHKNRTPLDCRRSNLRVCTTQQNQQNMSGWRKPTSSRHKGVCWDKSRQRWMAAVTVNYRLHNLGYFDSEDEAAEAAAEFRREHLPYSID